MVDIISLLDYNKSDMGHISSGWRQLACAILLQAVTDWKAYGGKRKCRDRRFGEFIQESEYATPRQELLSFFRSGGCEGLCCCIDLDYEQVLTKLCIERGEEDYVVATEQEVLAVDSGQYRQFDLVLRGQVPGTGLV